MDSTKQLLRQTAVVILCGGKGTRMQSAGRHKVCFPIEGMPAINRTVKMFSGMGATKIVLVVGALAENVISTVGGKFPHVMYVYQDQQLGTGHAAQIGVSVLKNLDHDGPVLITVGDKVIQGHIIRDLTEVFVRSRADLAFITADKRQDGQISAAGRIVTDRTGRILGNVELRDVQQAQIIEALAKLAARQPAQVITYDKTISLGRKYITDDKKLAKALWPIREKMGQAESLTGKAILELLGPSGGRIVLAGRGLTGDQVERRSLTVNLSVYLGHMRFWNRFLACLTDDNAQRESYLTDVINLSTAADDGPWKLVQHKIADPSEVMAFNAPDELLRVEDTLRRRSLADERQAPGVLSTALAKLPKGAYRRAGKWLELFDRRPVGLQRTFEELYGTDNSLMEERRKLFVSAIKLFIQRFGRDRKAIIIRAPGRINLLGRHIDHRGGAVNVMAIDRDVVFVAAPRDDDVVTLCNIQAKPFPDRQFSISELVGDIDWDDWLSYVNSDHVRSIISQTRGDWSNYVKASLVRLQQSFRDVRINGFDAAVAWDIPIAAGLSSSSALVVASAEAVVAFNGLGVTPSELVDLCGEGEWFVGSRGPAADHTAIRMGRRGQFAHVRFLPFQIDKICDFPDNCRMIIAHSGIDARKSAAKEKFNQKMASYELGFMLLKDRLVQYGHPLEHLRDLNPRRLNCPVSQIYRCLLAVPEYMQVQDLTAALSEHHRRQLDRICSTHRAPARYDLRGVLLYGVAECERSLRAPTLLEQGRAAEFGQLMRISHDGDRVGRYKRTADGELKMRKFRYDCSDQAMGRLCEDLASEDPDRVLAAQLYMQGGAYACSTPQIDKMIDAVCEVSGVYGAQMGGAGLGGCVMILARPEAIPAACKALKKEYFEPAGIDPVIHVCHGVAGSGLLTV